MELRNILSHLSGSLCILAGAGVSYSAPAGLPTVTHILNELLSALPISERDRNTLLDSLSPEWSDGLGYFDFLRFEQVMEALEYCGDLHVQLLQSVVRKAKPNKNHYQLARLLEAGHRILTTNFDCLIEKACDDLGIRYTVLVSNKDYDDYLSHPRDTVNPIFKVHGTALSGSVDASSIAATMQAVTTERNKMASKWAAVDNELAERDLMVIGYSGSDDFDVMPSIRFAPRRLLWIQHGTNDTPISWCMSQNQAPNGLGIDRKLHWFLCRMFGDFSYLGRVNRDASDVLITRMPTSHILDELLDQPASINGDQTEQPGIQCDRPAAIQLVPLFAGKESPQSLLFVGILFRHIGLFDRALKYLECAKNRVEGDPDMRIAPRVYTIIARIWLELERSDNATRYMGKALNLWNGFSKNWIDYLDAMEFSCRLGVLKATDEDFNDMVGLEDWLTPRQKTHIERAIHIWEGENLLATEGTELEAMQHMREFFKKDEFPLELAEKAEAQVLYLKINRACYWRLVNMGDRENAAWAQTEALKSQMMLKEACTTLEQLQRKTKWADAMLFQAEEHMWGVGPDWSEQEAEIAAKIYSKVGHHVGYARCIALLSHLKAIAVGEAGANGYRPLTFVESQEAGEETSFYCPRCRTFTKFRFRYCRKCGWFTESAPQSRSDAAAKPGDRSSYLHELFMRLGHSVLDSDPSKQG